jgi:hypothetical protein
MEQWNNGRKIRAVGPQNAECGMRNEKDRDQDTRDRKKAQSP